MGLPSALSNLLLRNPAAGGTELIFCSAATHNTWTGLWQLGQEESSRVDTDGAVNAVAVSRRGDLLAIGLGMYPLNPESHSSAAIELLSTADTSRAIARRVLPGVAIHKVVFHSSPELLIAVSGARSQDRGHIFLLNPHTLDILNVVEVESFQCLDVAVDCEDERLLLTYSDGIQSRRLDELERVEWRWLAPEKLSCAAYCSERDWVFLSDGRVIEPRGRELGQLTPLEECSGMVILQDGRVAGISCDGTLRVWKQQFAQVRS
jgi:hypothetical protein